MMHEHVGDECMAPRPKSIVLEPVRHRSLEMGNVQSHEEAPSSVYSAGTSDCCYVSIFNRRRFDERELAPRKTLLYGELSV